MCIDQVSKVIYINSLVSIGTIKVPFSENPQLVLWKMTNQTPKRAKKGIGSVSTLIPGGLQNEVRAFHRRSLADPKASCQGELPAAAQPLGVGLHMEEL